MKFICDVVLIPFERLQTPAKSHFVKETLTAALIDIRRHANAADENDRT